eukprot:gb/GECG01013219.1/.p1 GENE.gb/GECG01013219.1/~~gb/GECG01013219.1/.p1  ORF type:complete len:100 (+),score=5.75 gb/GECG01013219.1/:1-300(+)
MEPLNSMTEHPLLLLRYAAVSFGFSCTCSCLHRMLSFLCAQMAKDVSAFLVWAAEPKSDNRKRMGQEFMVFLMVVALVTGWYKRMRWMPVKTRKISYFK